MSSGLNSMAHTVPALTILILAWALSQIEQDLMLGEVLTERLQAMQFPYFWLPLAISIVAYVLSFATGTSWGTMGLLCPITIPMAINFAAALPPAEALTLFYASVGSTLGGAIFGDHCSPISGTTVLASIGADCPHFEHVSTQLPYALVVGLVALACGDVMCSVYGQPWYYGLAAGTMLLFLVVLVVGRRPKPSFEAGSVTSHPDT
jgi:Na+/H+ antiporter NhaC